ncbi:hypothetical protein [Halosimplex amylolyticum]|uniref:hypothetical protein n=1 Tax=Halosimplex amylolyticum TaxID=3396616 RepID=UPI003F550A9A
MFEESELTTRFQYAGDLEEQGVDVGVMLVDFQPEQLWWFVAAMLVLSVTYGLLGMLAGVVFNCLAGLWILLILPMIDIGLFRDPLFVQSEPEW